MFSIDFSKSHTSTTYGMKMNGELIQITRNAYWKKDFLEASLATYAKYLKHGEVIYLEDYLNFKNSPGWLMNKLVPQKIKTRTWPGWFCNYAGYRNLGGARIEVYQYNYKFSNGRVELIDSLLLYRTLSN